MQKILRINMTALSARYEDVPGEFIRLGGRSLSSPIVSKEVDLGVILWDRRINWSLRRAHSRVLRAQTRGVYLLGLRVL
jgi:hypothetical protein